jgi:hypothetical protein
MSPRARFLVVCALAALHAAAPLALLFLNQWRYGGDPLFVTAVSFYWSWPLVWLYPLIRGRYESFYAFWGTLAFAAGALAWGFLPIAFITAMLGGAKT